MNFLDKIQKLPETSRKIILWSIVIILSLILGTFQVKNTQKKLKEFKIQEIKESFQLPALKEKLDRAPQIEIEIPEINQETLKQIEELLKENQNSTSIPEN